MKEKSINRPTGDTWQGFREYETMGVILTEDYDILLFFYDQAQQLGKKGHIGYFL